MKKTSIALVLASLALFVAAPAFADESGPAKGATVTNNTTEKGYGYKFDDDPLQSGVSGTTGFVIKVRPKGARGVLLRPRVHFIPEMLKSVEAI